MIALNIIPSVILSPTLSKAKKLTAPLTNAQVLEGKDVRMQIGWPGG